MAKLTKSERAYYKRLRPFCQHFTEADETALERLCKNLALIDRLTETLDAEGYVCKTKTGYMQPHPAVAIKQNAEATAIKLLKEFGLTPQSRARNRFGEDKTRDELDNFLESNEQ